MPKQEESAIVTINGQVFRDWKSLILERTHDANASECTLETAEVGTSGGWAGLRLKPGDAATVSLAGRISMTGLVVVRQVVYDAERHGLQIKIESKILDIVRSSVKPKPGEFRNYSFEQIAKSVLAPFGINLKWFNGIVPPGADRIFPRVNMPFGEPVYAFLERIGGKMRNLHFRDDENGDLIAFRATGKESVVAQLQEGRNIKAASLILNAEGNLDEYETVGQIGGTDQFNGDAAAGPAASAKATNPSRGTFGGIVMEHAGTSEDASMRTDREVAQMHLKALNCTITVQGWLLDDGTLWIEHLNKQVTIVSPMLFPFDGPVALFVRGVTHTQDDQGGTQTMLDLCDPQGMGRGLRSGVDPGAIPELTPSMEPAQPLAT